MEYLAGKTLVKMNKENVSANEALNDTEIIAFYFSAHWCPPCRIFTPVLADFYAAIKKKELPLEIIFVSSDETEEEFYSYMNESHGDWLAIPYGSPVILALKELKQELDVQGIPRLIVMKRDGTVLSNDGRSDVEEKGISAFYKWKDADTCKK